jgi:diguanylate cyclase (GGDEF)-like protein
MDDPGLHDRNPERPAANRALRGGARSGCFERLKLVEVLEAALAEAARFRSSCGFALLGVDYHAHLEDAHGIAVTEEIVAAVGQRLALVMRGKDTLRRYSVGAFGLLLRDCTPDDMAIAAGRLVAGVREAPFAVRGGTVPVSITIGAVAAPRHARSVAEAFARAEETLKCAQSGRAGSFVMYQPDTTPGVVQHNVVAFKTDCAAA